MKKILQNKLILSALTGAFACTLTPNAFAADAVNNQTGTITIKEDIISSNVDPNWIKIPGATPEVTYKGTITMAGTKKEVDKFVRKLKPDGTYVGGYNTPPSERFTPEERERHLLISSFAPGATTNLLGDDKSTYNVDSVVAIEGGTVNITGKDLTTNLVYLTTPLSTSKYAKKDKDQRGKMHIKLSGNLIAHNDDWDLYPRMDGFHYYHSSNLYSRGGISVNGNNELTIEAKRIEARYLRNSDWHHGEGKALVNIKADEFDLNRLGRAAYTPDGKADEQWVAGKTSDDKGGMFQFYNTKVNIDAKDVKIGGVRPGQTPREDDLTADRIDIDAGNRAEITIAGPEMKNFYHDGEIRAIDGSTVNIKATEKVTGRNAYAGYTENYRYGYFNSNNRYIDGLYYYNNDGDLPNEDMSTINISAPNVEMNVSHQAEEGGYNHIGWGKLGAAHNGILNITAEKDLKINNAWNGFEGKGPNTVTVEVSAGGVTNLQGENVLLDGSVMLGNITKPYDEPVYDQNGKRVYKSNGKPEWNYRRRGIWDTEAGRLNITGHGKDKGTLQFGGEICGINSNLNVSNFKNVNVAVFTGLWNSNALGTKLNFHNIHHLTFDATNQWHLDNHKDAEGNPQPSHPNHGKGYVILNAIAGDMAINELNIKADEVDAKGIIAGRENFTFNLDAKDAKLYRLNLGNNTRTNLKAENLIIDTEALVQGYKAKLNIEAKNLHILGNEYFTHPTRPLLNDNIIERGNLGALTVAGIANANITIRDNGTLKGNILDNVMKISHPTATPLPVDEDYDAAKYKKTSYNTAYGHAHVNLGNNATWSYQGASVVEKLTGNNSTVDLTLDSSTKDSLIVNQLAGKIKFKINATPTAEASRRSRRAAEATPWANVDKIIVSPAKPAEDNKVAPADINLAVVVDNPNSIEELKNKKLIAITDDGEHKVKVNSELVAEPNAVLAYAPKLKLVTEGANSFVVLEDMTVTGGTTNALVGSNALTAGYLAALNNSFGTVWNRNNSIQRNGNTGLWLEYEHGKYSYHNTDAKLHGYTLGYDAKRNTSDGSQHLGIALINRHGSSDFANGSSKLQNNGIAIYGGMEKAGFFTNAWLSGTRLHDDYTTNTMDSGKLQGTNWTYGVEFGKEYTLANNYYFTPQFSLAFSNWQVDKLTTKQGLNLDAQSLNSRLARLGFTFGKSTDKQNIYASLAALHQFGDDLAYTIKDSNNTFNGKERIKGTWYEIGLGGTYDFNNRLKLNGNFQKSFGGKMNGTYQGSISLNYLF